MWFRGVQSTTPHPWLERRLHCPHRHGWNTLQIQVTWDLRTHEPVPTEANAAVAPVAPTAPSILALAYVVLPLVHLDGQPPIATPPAFGPMANPFAHRSPDCPRYPE